MTHMYLRYFLRIMIILLKKLLIYKPEKRIFVKEALAHPFFLNFIIQV